MNTFLHVLGVGGTIVVGLWCAFLALKLILHTMDPRVKSITLRKGCMFWPLMLVVFIAMMIATCGGG